jgi:hypothetical protein
MSVIPATSEISVASATQSGTGSSSDPCDLGDGDKGRGGSIAVEELAAFVESSSSIFLCLNQASISYGLLRGNCSHSLTRSALFRLAVHEACVELCVPVERDADSLASSRPPSARKSAASVSASRLSSLLR